MKVSFCIRLTLSFFFVQTNQTNLIGVRVKKQNDIEILEDEFSKVYHIYKDKLKNKLVQAKEKAKNGIKWLVDSLLDEDETKSGSDAISKQVEEVKNLLTSSVLFDNKLIAKEENVITRLNESVQSLLSRNKRVAIDTEKIKNETIKKFLSKNSVLFRSILPNNPMIIGLNPLKIIEDSKLDKTLEQLAQIETTTEANQGSSESVDEAVETTDEVSKKPKGFLFKVADPSENEAQKHGHELLHESDSENMSILNLVSNNGAKGEEIHSETHEQDETTENAMSTIEVDVSTTTTEVVTPSTPLILSSMDLPPSVTNLVEFKQAEQTTLGSIVEFSAETTTESSTTTTTLESTTTELITEPTTIELITEPANTELATELVTTNLPSTTTELLTTDESTTELIITETTTTTTTTESSTTTTTEPTTASTTELVTTTTELTTTTTETSTTSILETTLVETTPIITTESTTTESLITETTTIPTTSLATETESTSTISVDTTADIVTEAATTTTPVTELITETTTITPITELITTSLSETTTISTPITETTAISTSLAETTTSTTQSTVVLTTSQVLVDSTVAQANATTVKANVTNGLENDIKFEVLNYTVVNASAANDSKSYSLRLHIKGYKWNEKFNNVTSLEAQEFMRKRILPLLYKHLNVSHDELNEVKLLRLFKGGNNGNKSRKV
jgi:hypothetical protein